MINKILGKVFEIMTKETGFSNFVYGKPSEDRWYEVIRKSDGNFWEDAGSITLDEAVEKARRLAVQYPSEEFIITGPVTSVKADIPVVVERII